MKFLRVVWLLSAACILVFAQTGLAAEKTPSFDWTGPYIGLHVGYGWGDADTDFNPLPSATQFVNLAPQTLRPDPSGAVGGIQGGYNYQMGCFVFGIEADFSGSGMSGTKNVSPIIQNNGTPFAGGVLSAHQSTDWYGTVRPRVGFLAMPTLLLYATGGFAYGEVNYSASTDYRPVGNTVYASSYSKTKVGWTVGAGAEYAVSKHWTVKTEYLYIDLGSESAIANPQIPAGTNQVGYKWQTTDHTFNVGLNYKF